MDIDPRLLDPRLLDPRPPSTMNVDPKPPSVEDIIAWSREIAFEEGYVAFKQSADQDLIDTSVYEAPELDKPVRRPTPWTMFQALEARDEALKNNPAIVTLAHQHVDEQLRAHSLTDEAADIQDDLPRKLALLHDRTQPPAPPPKPEVMFVLLKRGNGTSPHQPWGHVDWFPVYFTVEYPWHAVESQLCESSKWRKRGERQSDSSPWICCHMELRDSHPHLADMVHVTGATAYKEVVLKISKDRRYHTAIFFQVKFLPFFDWPRSDQIRRNP